VEFRGAKTLAEARERNSHSVIGPTETHVRRKRYGWYEYRNPVGVVIYRTPTAKDKAAREAWLDNGGREGIRRYEATLKALAGRLS
jgi:hypothetical protein